ncbi:ABC transporter permease [Nonomuraea sp. NPDC046570]|uniref:ABC transporter permease n=1 Tax=Nonomuraea sp. NPDC046570 TaxID=3155255 RepID=UPI0033CAE63A
MKGFAKKTGQAVLLMLGCTLLVFAIQVLSGRDPGRAILGTQATQTAVDALNHRLGVDQPLLGQYLDFVAGLARGDLGLSFYSGAPVTEILAGRAPVTASLIVLSFVISLVITFPTTLLAVRNPGGPADVISRGFVLAGTVIPSFWLGILLILVIALPTGLFPAGGYPDDPSGQLRALVLPAITVAVGLAPVQIRTLRSAWLRAMRSPYVEAPRSRGVGTTRLLISHALPNSLNPLVSLLAVQAGWAAFGAVIVENTFRLPGIGQGLIVDASHSDFPLVNGTTLLLAFVVVLVSSAADGLARLLDPRLRSAQ